MTIVIPMAGMSSRFFNAGYNVPKYMLPLGTESVFYHVVKSFELYFKTDTFRFIAKPEAVSFIEEEVDKLGISDYQIFEININTKGQAETVYLGCSDLPDDEILIFNIDTIRKNFSKSWLSNTANGYLEVFIASGDHWSFVYPKDGDKVSYTTEKVKISNLCSNGLYYFRQKSDFFRAYEKFTGNASDGKEVYIAPLYNILIEEGLDIRYEIVSANDVICCGTPREYLDVFNNYKTRTNI